MVLLSMRGMSRRIRGEDHPMSVAYQQTGCAVVGRHLAGPIGMIAL
jgi:hypothetical protein